jgi:hypothetical protein
MADKEVEKVKIKGFLWSFQLALGIIKDLLIIAAMILIIWQVIVLAPKVNEQLTSLKTMQESIGSNLGQNNNPNYQADTQYKDTGQYSPDSQAGASNQTSQDKELQELSKKLLDMVENAKWDEAMLVLNKLKTYQLPANAQSTIGQLEQAIKSKDKQSFERIYYGQSK